MAEATSADVTRPLPEEIVIWEILARLPPKPLLRCRAVCRAWRRATSTRDFLLAHHSRQPTLRLVCDCHESSIDIVPFDHRAGVAAADQLQPVARLDDALFRPVASRDGLLVLYDSHKRFSICNPATRQYAPLHQLNDFRLLGMYPHSPTGEYGLLTEFKFPSELMSETGDNDSDDNYDDDNDGGDDYDDDNDGNGDYDDDDVFTGDGFYVFTLGSTDPPRHLGRPDVWEETHALPALLHGSLHWYMGHTLTVFNTTAELFRQMRSPIVSCDVDLFESGGMLGMSVFYERTTTVDIWVMQDYAGEVWALRHKVEFPVADLAEQFGRFRCQWTVVVPSWDGHVFGLAKFGECLLQIDVDGKLVASFHMEGLGLTPLLLKQTLLPHTFFAAMEGYVVDGSPFI